MNIKIYQINFDRDVKHLAFMSYERTQRLQGSKDISSELYDKVYEGNVTAKDLEDVYRIFNMEHPSDFRGHSLSVSDVVQVCGNDPLRGFHFCDSFGFVSIDFEPEKTKRSPRLPEAMVYLCVGSVKENIFEGTYDECLEFCTRQNWEFSDENEFLWELEIEDLRELDEPTLPEAAKDDTEINFYEICISPDSIDSISAQWICIKGISEPSIQEAEAFLRAHDSLGDKEHVLRVQPIEEERAREEFSFENEDSWPVFGEINVGSLQSPDIEKPSLSSRIQAASELVSGLSSPAPGKAKQTENTRS